MVIKILSDVLFDGLVQDCSNSSANALELLQSCTKPSIHARSMFQVFISIKTWSPQCFNICHYILINKAFSSYTKDYFNSILLIPILEISCTLWYLKEAIVSKLFSYHLHYNIIRTILFFLSETWKLSDVLHNGHHINQCIIIVYLLNCYDGKSIWICILCHSYSLQQQGLKFSIKLWIYTVSLMSADGLVMQGTEASAAIILT